MNLFHRSSMPKTAKMQTAVTQLSLSPLEKLVNDDPKMYAALQNFLIVDPERQIPLLDTVSALSARGDASKAEGNSLSARADYEVAAKIEIYRQNKVSAMNFLVLAESVSDKKLEHFGYQQTMLANMDKVLSISRAYQSFVPHLAK